jgi:apolipoprotein N-acyltransferase
MSPSPGPTPLPRLRRLAEVLAVSLAGGLVLLAATRYEALGPLVALGWAVLMVPAVIDRWRAPVLGFLPGLLLFMWVANLPLLKFGWIALALLPAVITLHYVVQSLLAWSLHRVSGWPLFVVLPLTMAAGEWTRAILGVGNYNMYQAGTFLFGYPVLIQAADLVGSYGLTFLWSIPAGLLADLAKRAIDGPRPGDARRLRWGAGLAAAAVAFLGIYGAVRIGGVAEGPGPRIAVVQPALEHSFQLTPQVLAGTVQQTIATVPRGGADLIAWPENSILANLDRWPEYEKNVAAVARTLGTPVLFGTQNFGPDGQRPTNTAMIIDPAGERAGRYDKVVLFPFTERRGFPWLERQLPALGRWLTQITLSAWRNAPNGYAGPGAIPLTLQANGREWTFWTPLCYESCYPELGREARQRGAEFFVNLSSEGWLGWALSNNQMGVNILRAVENRVGMVRVGNTGPSAFVAPDGRVEEYLRGARTGRYRLEEGTLIRPVTVPSGGPPPYTRWGGLIDRAWGAAWVAAMAWFLVRRRLVRTDAPR